MNSQSSLHIMVKSPLPSFLTTQNSSCVCDIQPNQEAKVLANVSDLMSGVKNVTLSYGLDDSAAWIDLPMTLNSTTGLYEATILGQQANTLVKYRITAYDNAGNYKVEDNSGQYHNLYSHPGISIKFNLVNPNSSVNICSNLSETTTAL